MDGPTIQARVYAGYARAAKRTGLLYGQYRPVNAAAPMSNQIATITCAFDSTSNYEFKKPNGYGDPTWYALVDDATTQAGDYLSGNGQTFFVAGKQFLLPVQAVECNRTVALVRPVAPTSPTGVQAYGGSCTAEGTTALGTMNPDGSLLVGWPCSILLGGRQGAPGKLPMSVGTTGWQILLPPSMALTINASDVFLDDLGRRYVVDGAERSDMGWRINTKEAHP